MSLAGGTLLLSGPVEVYSLEVASNARLGLTGLYEAQVATEAVFNDGSSLQSGFTADGVVSALSADSITLNGNVNWHLQALPDYYATGAEIQIDDNPFDDESPVTNSFAEVTLAEDNASPTLQFSINNGSC